MAESRVVLVTGVTRGLGRAMVDRLVEAGQTVVGCGTSSDRIAELQREYSAPHQFSAVDVADDAAVCRWARSLLERGLVPDLLLNNAAIINVNAPLWEIGHAEMSRLLAVNIGGVVNIIRHFVPAMVERGRGVIVNFSSGWGRSTAPEVAPYCASKFAIEGLTLALAQELPQGMAAAPLNPGIINTEMLQSCFGSGASSFPDADAWSRTAVPFLLQLGARDNGRSLSVPG